MAAPAFRSLLGLGLGLVLTLPLEEESFLAGLEAVLARLMARGGAAGAPGSLSLSSDLARDPPASPASNFWVLIQWNKSIGRSANNS